MSFWSLFFFRGEFKGDIYGEISGEICWDSSYWNILTEFLAELPADESDSDSEDPLDSDGFSQSSNDIFGWIEDYLASLSIDYFVSYSAIFSSFALIIFRLEYSLSRLELSVIESLELSRLMGRTLIFVTYETESELLSKSSWSIIEYFF